MAKAEDKAVEIERQRAEAKRRLGPYRIDLDARDNEIRACIDDGIAVAFCAEALNLSRNQVNDIKRGRRSRASAQAGNSSGNSS